MIQAEFYEAMPILWRRAKRVSLIIIVFTDNKTFISNIVIVMSDIDGYFNENKT